MALHVRRRYYAAASCAGTLALFAHDSALALIHADAHTARQRMAAQLDALSALLPRIAGLPSVSTAAINKSAVPVIALTAEVPAEVPAMVPAEVPAEFPAAAPGGAAASQSPYVIRNT